VREECDPILNLSRLLHHVLSGPQSTTAETVFDIILHEPEIPPNTGNVIRLCANTGSRLHLVKPLGFRLDANSVRRAGLDYQEMADVRVHASLEACLEALGRPRWFAFSTRAHAAYDSVGFERGDALVFGAETRGAAGRRARGLSARTTPANPDAGRQPQSQSLECRRGGRVRGLAPARVRQPVSALIERFINAKTASRGDSPS
jgi:tRNA (cytidine(34)-2'-O)-methyltransferase